MISKSDLIILVLASSALAVGIFRWHQNTQDVNAITIPASSRVVVETFETNNGNVVDGNAVAGNVVEPLANAGLQTVTDNQLTSQTIAQAEVVATPVVKPVVITAAADTAEPISVGKHQVRSGDYLGKIASQYGTDVQTLRDLNNISGSIIQIGQEILYPL